MTDYTKYTAADLPDNSFAAACYDQCTPEFLSALTRDDADESDMISWGLTAQEWFDAVCMARAALANDQ